jgi:hypothetical protein
MLTEPDAVGALEPELAGGVLEVEVAAELDELLLHPAARPVHARASRATRGALLFVKAEIIYRTLPLIVAARKEPRHDWDELGAVRLQTRPIC